MTNRQESLALMLVLAAGVLLGVTLGHRFPFKVEKDFWDVATSIGTVGAVIVALWQAGRVRRDKQTDAVERAHIVGAMRIMALHDLAHDLRHMQHRCETLLTIMPDAATLFSKELDIFRALSHPMLAASVEELLALYNLDKRRAVQLASTLGALRQHGRNVENLQRREGWIKLDLEKRYNLIEMWVKVAQSNGEVIREFNDSLKPMLDEY